MDHLSDRDETQYIDICRCADPDGYIDLCQYIAT